MHGFVSDGHKACPTFVNIGGVCVLRRILENRTKYSEDGILSLLTCVGLISSHWSLRNHCVESGIMPIMLVVAQSTKCPQVRTYLMDKPSRSNRNYKNCIWYLVFHRNCQCIVWYALRWRREKAVFGEWRLQLLGRTDFSHRVPSSYCKRPHDTRMPIMVMSLSRKYIFKKMTSFS